MQNDVKDIHYYAYFNENTIELWYITGVYDMVMCDDKLKFNDLLFFIGIPFSRYHTQKAFFCIPIFIYD